MVKRFLWHAQDLGEENLNSFFISALVDMRASLILQNEAMQYLCVTGLPDCWTVDSNSVPADDVIFGRAIAEQLAESKFRALKTGNSLPDVQAVTGWVEQAGAAPSATQLREWLRAQVPEYQARS